MGLPYPASIPVPDVDIGGIGTEAIIGKYRDATRPFHDGGIVMQNGARKKLPVGADSKACVKVAAQIEE